MSWAISGSGIGPSVKDHAGQHDGLAGSVAYDRHRRAPLVQAFQAARFRNTGGEMRVPELVVAPP